MLLTRNFSSLTKGVSRVQLLLSKEPFVSNVGKDRAEFQRNSGRFFRFFLSNGMLICVLPGMGSNRIVVYSEQHKLQRAVYSTIEHAATILRMSLTPAELCSQLVVCFCWIKRLMWRTGRTVLPWTLGIDRKKTMTMMRQPGNCLLLWQCWRAGTATRGQENCPRSSCGTSLQLIC